MKKITLLCLLISIISCQDKNQKLNNSSSPKIETQVDSSKIYKENAITILNEVNNIVKKGVSGKLSKDKVNYKINPLMKKYEIMLLKLNKKDSIEVQKYRIKQINEMINLQIEQSH